MKLQGCHRNNTLKIVALVAQLIKNSCQISCLGTKNSCQNSLLKSTSYDLPLLPNIPSHNKTFKVSNWKNEKKKKQINEVGNQSVLKNS